MPTKILEHGDYQGTLPEGWDVVELPSTHTLVKKSDMAEMIKQLADCKAVINQTARVFAQVNKLDPNIFTSGSINWGSLVMKLTNAKDLGPEFSKLNDLVQAYNKNYNVIIAI